MANVLRSPFWVPRPDDIDGWATSLGYAHPPLALVQSFISSHLTSTPTFWSDDDTASSVVFAESMNSPQPLFALKIQNKLSNTFFNQGFDETTPSVVLAEWSNDPQPLFALGKAKPFSNTYYFSGFDETAPWYTTLGYEHPPFALVQSFSVLTNPPQFWTYDEVAPTVVLSEYLSSPQQLLSPKTNPFSNPYNSSRLGYDDPPAWLVTLNEFNLSRSLSSWQASTVQAPFYVTRPGDESFWVGAPSTTLDLFIQPQVKFYGQAGQAYPFRWNATLDDSSLWSVASSGFNRDVLKPLPTSINLRPVQWVQDDASLWSAASSGFNVNILRIPLTVNLRPVQWTQDDASVWTASSSGVNRNVLTTGHPAFITVRPVQWVQDDASVWNAQPQASQPILVTTTQVKFYGQSGQAYPFRWNATFDDYSLWSIASQSPNENLQKVPQAEPFFNLRPSAWTQDDPPPWARSLQASQPVFLTTTQTKIYGQPGQVVPFRANFTIDDYSVWTWPSQSWNKNALLQVTAPLVHPLPPPYSEDAFWVGAPTARNGLVQVSTAFIHPPPQFYSEDAFWVGIPRPRNNLVQVSTPFLHPLPPFYSEDAYWVGAPLSMRTVSTQARFYGQPGQTPPFRPNFTLDDASLWTWPSQHSYAAVLTTTQQKLYGRPGQVVPHFWSFNYDDTAVWWRYVVPALTNFFVIPVPPPPAANVVYAVVHVAMTLSSSIVSALTSITSVGTADSGSVASSVTTISTVGDEGSNSNVS